MLMKIIISRWMKTHAECYQGMAEAADDPYTVYYTDQMKDFKENVINRCHNVYG